MDDVRKNEIIAVILFSISLFLFLSMFTFSEQDLSFYTSSPNLVCQNVAGLIGSYVGGALLFTVGKAAYVIPLLACIWGGARLLQIEENKISFKIFGTIVLTGAVSSCLSMLSDPTQTSSFKMGGLVGSLISELLIEYLGRIGAGIFIVALIILSLLIATEFLILPILLTLYKYTLKLPSKIRDIFSKRELFKIHIKKQEKPNKISKAKEEIAKKLQDMRKQVEERKIESAKRTEKPLQKEKDTTENKRAPKISKPAISSKKRVQPTRTTPVMSGNTGEKLEYKMPGIDVFQTGSREDTKEREIDLRSKADVLENTLREFGVEAKVVKINPGPVITMYELEPALGTRVNKVTSLTDNISLALKSANIRILAPIPGKGTIGIEVPNKKSEMVMLRDILETEEYSDAAAPLRFALGKDVAGEPIVPDLGSMPHLLIAGATGSGKTVCINAIISSYLYNSSPEEVKFLMIDPKSVELMMYEGIPHLLSPIVTNPKKAASSLGWVVSEMERRYEVLADKGVRNISVYKEKMTDKDENLPFIVVIVDELADLMMVAQQDVESTIMRIAQLARAAGIHLILATQRPSVNVITGVIKANIPARISFKVASKVASSTVLDANGAEKLLGRGDMLFMEPGETSLIRGQCCYVDDREIKDLVKFVKGQTGPQYISAVIAKQEKKYTTAEQEKDELFDDAVELILDTGQASVSMLQRKFRIGYTRAARIIDIMEEKGVIGSYNGSKPREILIDSIEEMESRETEVEYAEDPEDNSSEVYQDGDIKTEDLTPDDEYEDIEDDDYEENEEKQ